MADLENIKSDYFLFEGRIRRSVYLKRSFAIYILFLILCLICVTAMEIGTAIGESVSYEAGRYIDFAGILLLIIVFVLFFIAILAQKAKRLHDLNNRAGALLFAGCVSAILSILLVGCLISILREWTLLFIFTFGAISFISLWGLLILIPFELYLLLADGTVEPNKYGDDSKERTLYTDTQEDETEDNAPVFWLSKQIDSDKQEDENEKNG